MDVLSWLSDFAMSSGFAGVLAVVAAIVAYASATKNAAKERWWKRAEFASNMTLSSDPYIRLAGLDMLGSMSTTDAGERTFIRVALKWFLARQTENDIDDDADATPAVAPRPGPATRVGMRIDGILRRPGR